MWRGFEPPGAPVPEWLRGLWRRRSIARPGGWLDTTTTVYWLQTEHIFADIRIPADRPDVRRHSGLGELERDDRIGLSRQGGFAGWTELRGDRCVWHRLVDYQPSSGVPDEGRLIRGDGVLVEEGIHEPYIEIWEPVRCGPGPLEVLLDARRFRAELVVACGDAFLAVRDRPLALPPAASLEALIAAESDSDVAAAWLDCEIAYGMRRGGRRAWEIQLCTLPFREGDSLLAGARPAVHGVSPA